MKHAESLKILFVEDNPADAEIARREIKKEKIDFSFRVVDTEDEFRKALNQFEPDLIISDYSMPSFDGMSALQITRSFSRHIPFIILTGSITEEVAVTCMKAGADDYVIKEKIKRLPFAVNEVVDKLRVLKEKESAENRLRRSEERFRELAEMLPVVVFETDINNRLIYANRKAFDLFGYSPQKLADGLDGFEMLAAEDQERARSNFQARLAGKDFGLVEFTAVREDRSTFPILLTISAIKKEGNIEGFRGIIIDVTDIQQKEKALKEREEELSAIYSNAPLIMLLLDKDRRITKVNKFAERISHRSPREMVGMTVGKALRCVRHQEIPPGSESPPTCEECRLRDLIQSTIADGTSHTMEKIALTFLRDGTEVQSTMLLSTKMLTINGEPFALVTLQDISEEENAIAEMRASRERLRILFDYAPDGYFLVDLKGRILDINQQGEKLVGKKREQCLGENMLQVFNLNAEDKKQVRGQLARNAAGHSTERGELTVTRPQGSQVVAEISMHPVTIGSESLVLGIARDITQPKQLQNELEKYRRYLEDLVKKRTESLNKALQDSEANRDRIDTILKSVSDGLIVTDINHHIILMNSLAEEFLGIRFSEYINRRIDTAIKNPKLKQLLAKALLDPSSPVQADIQVKGKEKPSYVLELTTKSIIDRGGRIVGVLTTLRDVTQEREIDRMKTEFLSTAAHELRTPLTSIQGFSEILLHRKDLKQKDQKKFLGYINKQAVILAHILSELLDISRIESGVGFTLQRELCDLNGIISRLIDHFRLSNPNHTFVSQLQQSALPVYADSEKIDQVLQNLLSNAIRYSPDGGEIRISTHCSSSDFQVTIEDQGIGMTAEQVKRVFDKFYRADASDTAPEGTGLGMSIVKLILDNHNGRIWLESQPKKGTRVMFTLPLGTRDKARGHRGYPGKSESVKKTKGKGE